MQRSMMALSMMAVVILTSCKVKGPGRIETAAARRAKGVTIGGRGLKNPVPDTVEAVKTGAALFQHQCQMCHGLDGHNTGVPFADRMSPPVPDLGQEDTQDYKDGQLKWIIENGIRFTGMPGWDGVLDDDQMWHLVRYLRHLPPKGTLGVPAVFKEAEEQRKTTKGKIAFLRRPVSTASPQSLARK